MSTATDGNEDFEEDSMGVFREILSSVTKLNFVLPALLALVIVYIGYKYIESNKKVKEGMIFVETEGTAEETAEGTEGNSHAPESHVALDPKKEIEQYVALTKNLENLIKSYNEFISSKKKKELTVAFKRQALLQRCKTVLRIRAPIQPLIVARKEAIKSREKAGALDAGVLEAYQKMELSFNKEAKDIEDLAKELDDPKKDGVDQPFHKLIWKIANEELEAEHKKLLKEHQARQEEAAKKKREKQKEKKKRQKEKQKAKKDEQKKIQDEEERKKITLELYKSHGLENLLEKEVSKETKENGH